MILESRLLLQDSAIRIVWKNRQKDKPVVRECNTREVWKHRRSVTKYEHTSVLDPHAIRHLRGRQSLALLQGQGTRLSAKHSTGHTYPLKTGENRHSHSAELSKPPIQLFRGGLFSFIGRPARKLGSEAGR